MLSRFVFIPTMLISLAIPMVYASGTMSEKEVSNIERTEIISDDDRQRLSVTAGLLSDYEFAAKKLVDSLNKSHTNASTINAQAFQLLTLSENIIDSARFRLPQCEEYLAKTLELKDMLNTISHDRLEKDYHHDGALPKAPGECYHTKDLFVHPATVLVLTRDDPSLSVETKESIFAEITEVLAHTELVRQLVIY
jgi:hypothetical protein